MSFKNDNVFPQPYEMFVIQAGIHGFVSPIGFRRVNVSCRMNDGNETHFPDWRDVPEMVHRYEPIWRNAFSKTRPSLAEIAYSSALFFYSFLCIHPFVDGNGRTAKEILRRVLLRKGFAVVSYDLVDRYLHALVSYRVQEDLDQLKSLFLASITPLQIDQKESREVA